MKKLPAVRVLILIAIGAITASCTINVPRLTKLVPGEHATANYDGTYNGTLSGTKTVPIIRSTANVNLPIVLTVGGDRLQSTTIGDQTYSTPLLITDSIPGTSQLLRWEITGGPCPFRITGSFHTGTAIGKSSSGTWTYLAGKCTGGGVWMANAR